MEMRSYYPGQIAISLVLLLAGVLLVMDRFDIIQVTQLWNLWPVMLIAVGLEQIFLWATSRDDN